MPVGVSRSVGRWLLQSPIPMRGALRTTSCPPPPPPPPKEGTFSRKYDTFISRWPIVHALHHRVVNGTKWCVKDVKTLWSLRGVNAHEEKALASLSVPELETLVQVPTEAPQVCAVLIVSPLPFAFPCIAAAIIFFPRLILTRQFWKPEQREEFFSRAAIESQERAKELAGKKLPPRVEECSFEQKRLLSTLHGSIPFIPWSSRKLTKRFHLLRHLDTRLKTEEMNKEQLIFHHMIRALPYSMGEREQDLRKRLEEWIRTARTKTCPVDYLAFPLQFPKSQ